MLLYAAIQYSQIDEAIKGLEAHTPAYLPPDTVLWNDVRSYLLAVPIIIALFSVVMSFEAWKLYDEFAWTIYKHISADLRMKRRFLTFQVGLMTSRCMVEPNR